MYATGSKCRVVFLGADFSQPLVVSFDTTLPTEAKIDASDTVDVGPSAETVNIAGGGPGIARTGDSVYVVGAFTGTVDGLPATGVLTGVGTILSGSGIAGCGG
jgi:hypothetical protein